MSQRLGYTVHVSVVHNHMNNATALMMRESYIKPNEIPSLTHCVAGKKKKNRKERVLAGIGGEQNACIQY